LDVLVVTTSSDAGKVQSIHPLFSIGSFSGAPRQQHMSASRWEWEAVPMEEAEDSFIAWAPASGAEIDNRGRIDFRDADVRGTVVTATTIGIALRTATTARSDHRPGRKLLKARRSAATSGSQPFDAGASRPSTSRAFAASVA
jgi:hypothetical protein